MTSLIFDVVTRALQPLLLLFSVFLLLSGHHEPGGGFTGGMVAATAFVLRAISRGTDAARAALRIPLPTLAGVGLLIGLGSALLPLLFGETFFKGMWIGDWGTPLLFDLGVYLVVMAVTLLFVFSLVESE